ncbi:MAG: tripartite tricarboxylate transporter permease, partial [Mycetocola sp.]
LLGFAMRVYSIPLAPVLIAAILGPLAETTLRQALAVSEGDPSILVSSPITVVLYVIMALAIVFTIVQQIRRRRDRLSQESVAV